MTRKVLLIDYESHSADRVRGVLQEPDYEVVAAHDGEEALNTFSSTHFDLVLLSGMLPRLPSAEVIREIRRRGGATAPPILLMVSGYKGSNSKADAQRVGAYDLLLRPFSDDTLRESADRAIAASDAGTRARSPVAPGAARGLTSSDIFSEVLDEFAREAPGPAPAARSAQAIEEEVEKRLRDTLSGVLPKAAAPPARSAAARASTSDDVERLLSETLSGLRTGRPRPASAAEPVAAAAGTGPAAAGPVADRFGQYEILERIASGGMAELFRARFRGAEGFQKIVAVKKILPHIASDEEFLAMFADEAKLAARLNHPNIVHIFDLGKIESGGYFIAMEYVDGRDLRSILQMARDTGLRMPIPLAVSIAAKVAAALDYAHRRLGDDGHDLHIVHRDVSPPNILVSTDGDIKLCDFGIARAASKVSHTESGALKGKVPYMSPEQAWGKAVDQRSDIYSLGAVVFELLAGRKLYRGESEMEILEKVRAGQVVSPSSLNSEVPPALDAAVLKALALEPDGRYAAVSEMLLDLEAVLRGYEPPPSSADLADYVRHLEKEEAALKAVRARETPAPPAPAPVSRPPRPKPARVRIPLPQAAQTDSSGPAVGPAPGKASPTPPPAVSLPPPPPPQPAPSAPGENPPAPSIAPQGIFASTFPAMSAESDAKKRLRLYILIAAAGVLLAVAGWLVVRKPVAARVPAPAATPAPVPVASAAISLPTAPPLPASEPKPLAEDAQRQLAARRRETPRVPETRRPSAPPAAGAHPTPAPVPPTAAPPPETPPEVKVAQAQPVPAEPTAAPVVAEPPPTAPPRAPAPAEVSRGDLVGPGPDVVEPALLSSPRIAYPAAARQQRVAGKVVVLVLVDEEGAVKDAKLQQGVASRAGVNEAVVDALRHAKFRPASKNGIPVKMWRTVVVDVKP